MRNLLVVRWLLSLPDCCDGFFEHLYVSEFIRLSTLNMCSSLCVNYISVMIFKNSKHITPSSTFLPFLCSSLYFLPFSDCTPLDEILIVPKCLLLMFWLYQLGVAKDREKKKNHCFSALVSQVKSFLFLPFDCNWCASFHSGIALLDQRKRHLQSTDLLTSSAHHIDTQFGVLWRKGFNHSRESSRGR